MPSFRVLTLSLSSLLGAALLLTNRYVSLVRPPVPFTTDTSFNARLYPERHVQRGPTIIELDWVVRNEFLSPDGVQKLVYTVNGLFPGPTIEARSGDRILLRVHNWLDKETTAIHFHGIRQIGSNSMDGTPGLTQCAIQPKNSFLYNFTIQDDQFGTYWWHSHSLSQRSDGLFGAFVVHEPIKRKKDFEYIDSDRTKEELRMHHENSARRRGETTPEIAAMSERIVLAGDWYHANSSEMLKWYQSKKSFGNEPAPENTLFNGVNTFNCSRASQFVNCDHSRGQKPSLSLDIHSRTRLRLVNTGSLAEFEISLESHALVVIEADGSPVAPSRVNSVTISPGQRYSVIIEASPRHKPRVGDTFWLRLSLSEECFKMPNLALDSEQFFLVRYGDPSSLSGSRPPDTLSGRPELKNFDPLSLTSPYPSPLPRADQQLMIYINSVKKDQLGGVPYGFVNRTSWKPNEHEPLLLKQSNVSSVDDWGKHQLVVTTHREIPSVVELIINNLDEGPHPFHLHGHHFYPLHVHRSTYGWGMYNYSSPPPIPSEAPVLRDTMVIPRRGHAVIRFLADAPGMWLFHCHVMVHLGTG